MWPVSTKEFWLLESVRMASPLCVCTGAFLKIKILAKYEQKKSKKVYDLKAQKW